MVDYPGQVAVFGTLTVLRGRIVIGKHKRAMILTTIHAFDCLQDFPFPPLSAGLLLLGPSCDHPSSHLPTPLSCCITNSFDFLEGFLQASYRTTGRYPV